MVIYLFYQTQCGIVNISPNTMWYSIVNTVFTKHNVVLWIFHLTQCGIMNILPNTIWYCEYFTKHNVVLWIFLETQYKWGLHLINFEPCIHFVLHVLYTYLFNYRKKPKSNLVTMRQIEMNYLTQILHRVLKTRWKTFYFCHNVFWIMKIYT